MTFQIFFYERKCLICDVGTYDGKSFTILKQKDTKYYSNSKQFIHHHSLIEEFERAAAQLLILRVLGPELVRGIQHIQRQHVELFVRRPGQRAVAREGDDGRAAVVHVVQVAVCVRAEVDASRHA